MLYMSIYCMNALFILKYSRKTPEKPLKQYRRLRRFESPENKQYEILARYQIYGTRLWNNCFYIVHYF